MKKKKEGGMLGQNQNSDSLCTDAESATNKAVPLRNPLPSQQQLVSRRVIGRERDHERNHASLGQPPYYKRCL
jgi:hypothetical protein